MTSPIFIDANVPIYVAGTAHELREPCRRVMGLVSGNSHLFFTDAEVLQELLHRYLSIGRWQLGRIALAGFATAMASRIEAMRPEDVERAAQLADEYRHLSARDLVHLATMQRLGSNRIVTADGGFDAVAGVERLDPMLVDEWARIVTDDS